MTINHNSKWHLYAVLTGLVTAGLLMIAGITNSIAEESNKERTSTDSGVAKAVFAGGCFWCVEADFDKVDGVLNAVSGYIGGSAATATYKQVSHENTGHYEAVQITYDPAKVSYAELVEYFWRTIDPTDAAGQFCDKGSSYRSAIFYETEEQQEVLQNSLDNLRENKPFDADIVTEIIPATTFYVAEEYHQNYYQRNPIRYKFYRNGCGRDRRLAELWGEN